MAFQMRLTDGVDALFTFTDGSNCQVDGNQDGWDLIPKDPAVEWTRENLRLLLVGTLAAIRTNLRVIEDVLYQARRYNAEGKGTRVYLEVKIEDGDAWQRSELRGGSFARYNLDSALFSNKLPVTLSYERRNFFEGAEVQLALSNGNGTNVTSGLTVFNCNDGTGASPNTRHSYAHIAAGAVVGSLPAPAKLVITNNFNNASGVAQIFVGHNIFSDPANLNIVLEAEGATGGSPGSDTTASGGSYRTFTLNNNGEMDMFTWSLSGAMQASCAGQYFKMVMRFFSSAYITDTWFRPWIYYNNVVPLWKGPLVRFSSNYARVLRDLCVIQLPPWLGQITNPAALSLRLAGKRATADDQTIALDFIYLLPLDSHRIFELIGEVPYQSKLVDDGCLNLLYTENSGSANRQGNVVGYGKPIQLVPGKAQRLYFLHHLINVNSAPITRTLSIQIAYRPRRLSL